MVVVAPTSEKIYTANRESDTVSAIAPSKRNKRLDDHADCCWKGSGRN